MKTADDSPAEAFRNEVARNIAALGQDERLKRHSLEWIDQIAQHKYTYNFRWLGRPIIQLPQDMVAMQELPGHERLDARPAGPL
jgi:cephalosporin hydroxylase